MKPQTLRKFIGILDRFLRSQGNPVVRNMIDDGQLMIPTAPDDPIETLSTGELDRMRQVVANMDGWDGSVARLLVGLLPFCGLRPGEIRQTSLPDVDLARWRIKVARGKGQGTWASPDFAPILPPARQTVLDFLDERKSYLNGQGHDALIPLRKWDGSLGYWSDGMLHKLKGRIQRESGVRFHLKTFRATFAQDAKDRGVSIETVSKALRHKTTKTTELYYSRIRADNAFAELEQAFEIPQVHVSPK